MKDYFCDMHVHIGATSQGRPVKITASRDLVFGSIVRESLCRKGMDMVAIVDCACPGVLRDVRRMVDGGELFPMPEGGLLHRERLAVIPASEVETAEPDGGVSHHVAYFPDLKTVGEFSRVMSDYISNMELSSQRARMSAAQLYDVTKATGGVLVPAHAFTPHKSLYGNAGRSLHEVFPREKGAIFCIELGLSADTAMADHLEELGEITFLSNSDAHSIPKIAREYNVIRMKKPCFQELILALKRRGGRHVAANVGMDPRLGRYHRSFCLACQRVIDGPPPVLSCPRCGGEGKAIVKGVYDRIREIAPRQEPVHPAHRPPYRYQVPLMFVPGINDRVLKYLLGVFGSEMAILNVATDEEIKKALPSTIARSLLDARAGRMGMDAGGGGHHGRVKDREAQYDQLCMDFGE
jgi:uncharacterized protein (TIGR00375 family)